MTFLAIWFCVALVVGILLGYAAHRLKRSPRARRVASNENSDESKHRHKLRSSNRASIKTKKLDA